MTKEQGRTEVGKHQSAISQETNDYLERRAAAFLKGTQQKGRPMIYGGKTKST